MKYFLKNFGKNFTYKYNKYLNPGSSMIVKDLSIIPSLNHEIQELIVNFESFKFNTHSRFFINNILFYQIKNKNEFFIICEMIFQFSREVSNKKLLLEIFSKVLFIYKSQLNRDDILKLRLLVSKNLFHKIMYMNILNEFENSLKVV